MTIYEDYRSQGSLFSVPHQRLGHAIGSAGQLVFDKNAIAKLGDMLLVGNATKTIDVEIPLSRVPKSVTINAMHDVLAR